MAENNKFKVSQPLMQDDRVQDMHLNLWSRLPVELVFLIITQTTCQSTQDAWCLATNKSRQLHEIAMETRWHSITIDDRDLLPAPGDDQIRFDEIEERLEELNISRDWKPAGQRLEALLTTNNSGRCSANYVRQIVFDFRMLRYWTDEMLSLEEPDAHEMMPSLEAAEYTLGQLKEHVRNLTHIICYGDTPQQLFDFVSEYATGVRVLLLRGLGSHGALHIYWRDLPDLKIYPSRRLPLKMGSLSILLQLVHLDIHRLSNHEVQAMMISLPKLINLQTLVIACNEAEHATRNNCAFDLLFSTIPEEKRNESVIWLPLGLRHLSMIDTYDEFR